MLLTLHFIEFFIEFDHLCYEWGAPDALVGTGSSTSDLRPGQSATELRWPSSLWVENGYLWVGERKFGHRIFRYNLG